MLLRKPGFKAAVAGAGGLGGGGQGLLEIKALVSRCISQLSVRVQAHIQPLNMDAHGNSGVGHLEVSLLSDPDTSVST